MIAGHLIRKQISVGFRVLQQNQSYFFYSFLPHIHSSLSRWSPVIVPCPFRSCCRFERWKCLSISRCLHRCKSICPAQRTRYSEMSEKGMKLRKPKQRKPEETKRKKKHYSETRVVNRVFVSCLLFCFFSVFVSLVCCCFSLTKSGMVCQSQQCISFSA